MKNENDTTYPLRAISSEGEKARPATDFDIVKLDQQEKEILAELLQAGKTLSPWEHLIERMKSMIERRRVLKGRNLVNEIIQKEKSKKHLSQCLEQDLVETERQERKVFEADSKSRAWIQEQRGKNIPYSEMTTEEARTIKGVSKLNKFLWVVGVVIFGLLESFIGYQLLANSKSVDPNRQFSFEYFAAALMGLILVLSVKFSKIWFKEETLVRTGKILALVGAGFLIGYLVLVRGFQGNLAAGSIPEWVSIVDATFLIGVTVLLPFGGVLLIDCSISKASAEKNARFEFAKRFLNLIRQVDQETHKLVDIRERISGLQAQIYTLDSEIDHLNNELKESKEVEARISENERASVVEAATRQYLNGVSTLEAMEHYTHDRRRQVTLELELWVKRNEVQTFNRLHQNGLFSLSDHTFEAPTPIQYQ